MFFIVIFTRSTFVIISLIAKFGFRTSGILFAPLITFYKIHRIFKITIKRFANGINLIRSSFSKVEAFSLAYIINMNIFSHRIQLPTTSCLGKTDLTSNFYHFKNQFLGIFAKTFLCCSSGASQMWTFSKPYLKFLKIGYYLALKVTLSSCFNIFSFSKRVSLVNLLALKISLL